MLTHRLMCQSKLDVFVHLLISLLLVLCLKKKIVLVTFMRGENILLLERKYYIIDLEVSPELKSI